MEEKESQIFSHSQDLFTQTQENGQEEEEPTPTPVTLTERLNIEKKASKCQKCQRDFDSERGLKIHLRTCKKQQIQNHTRQPDATDPIASTGATDERPKIWGDHTKEDINQISKAMYEEIVFWKKNLFKLPSGAAGKQFIVEMTRLITMWVEDSQPLCDVALRLLMVNQVESPRPNNTANI